MKTFEVILEVNADVLHKPYGTPHEDVYYIKDGKKVFDMDVFKATKKYVVKAFNIEAIKKQYPTALSINFLSDEPNIFDSLEKTNPDHTTYIEHIELSRVFSHTEAREVIKGDSWYMYQMDMDIDH